MLDGMKLFVALDKLILCFVIAWSGQISLRK